MKSRTAIAMTSAALFATVLMSGNAAAGDCKSVKVEASGESAGAVAKLRKRRAERRAKDSWEKYVAHEYGGRFADIDDAKKVKVSCDLNERGNTRCTVIAQPCSD